MPIIVRDIEGDDYIAWQTANSMDNAGCDVFSVTLDNKTWRIWAKYQKPLTPDKIDNVISADRETSRT